jgi:phosphoglycolate phosphatase
MKPAQIVVFDFDGTLCDSAFAMIALTNMLSQKYKFLPVQNPSGPSLEVLRTQGLTEVFKSLRVNPWMVPFIVADARRLFRNFVPRLRVFPEIREILLQLKAQNYRLFIVSSNSVSNIEAFCNLQQLQIFEAIYAVRGLNKKADRLKKMIKDLGVEPRHAVYVGDELRDIEAAHLADMPAIAVTWGVNSEVSFVGKTPYIAQKPADILSLLASMR